MPKGYVRRLDSLGRVSIPAEYRNLLGISTSEALEFHVDGRTLHLKKGKGRKLDELGRYTIPKCIRTSLKFENRELVDIYIENDELCIRKETLQCVFCGEDDEDKLVKRNGLYVCEQCIEELAEFIQRDVKEGEQINEQ